jgi:GR25 family glycosyltransferase involved in LPS biosynthesis
MNFNYILNQPAFVIHIEELSADRTNFFTNNIINAGYTDMRIFEGVKASDSDQLNKCITEFGNVKLHKDLGNGQKGCLFSHLKLYKHIISNNIPVCTIFEDDVHFHPNWNTLAFNYYNNTPKNFDILFIGNQLDECKNVNNRIPIVNTLSTFCTHAYIITFQGAQKMLTYLLNWDYNSSYSEKYVGHPLTGLFCIDIMIKNIQDRMNQQKLKKNITWYCWNGTRFPCNFNKLPLKGNDIRNTGLVFQSDYFESIVTNYVKKEFTNTEDIILPNNKVFIIKSVYDNIDITNSLKNIIKSFENETKEIILTKEHLKICSIPLNFNKLIITYKYDI